ncbi:MAG: glycine zipper 2TM domain-containing protein [Usitatibacter sp.]
MRSMNLKPTMAAALCALALGGCAYHGGSADYRGYEVRGEQTVRFGVVETTREVRIQPRDTGLGGASGAVLGGIAGSHAGGGSGHVAGAVAGAILGGVIGQEVERSGNQRQGVEITVQLDSGRYIAIVQEADEPFRSGDRVRIISGRGTARVTH